MKKTIFLICCLLPFIVTGQKFAVIGDYRGGDTNAFNVSQLVKSLNPEFIVTTGDNFLYSQGSIDFQIGQFYHEFIFPYQGTYGLGDTVNRFFPALGNHDLEATGLADYQAYFTLPGNERYYDFVKGNIHFFILNSNISEPDGNTDSSIQANWLQSALAASVSKYNLVFMHHPPYSSGTHGSNPSSQWPYKLWGATAVFGGHDHDYERLFIDSFPSFVCGAGGSPLYCTFTNIPGTQHFYCSDFGAMLIESGNDSMILKYYNIKDSLIDTYIIHSVSAGFKPSYLSLRDTDRIMQCFPNPYSGNTVIRYYLSSDCQAELIVYDSKGLRVKTLCNGKQIAGFHDIIWDTSGISAGIYTIALKSKSNIKCISTIKIELE